MGKKVLVVGGAGYIGSHMVKCLLRAGYKPLVLDNLSTGYRDAVIDAEFVEGDLADLDFLNKLFKKHAIAAVMHFASYIRVGESTKKPEIYYRNNVANTLNLLEAMKLHGLDQFIFSSTAAVYGEPKTSLIKEDHPRLPMNPYGRSKWMIEEILRDYSDAYGLKFVSLRYFNAAGADPDGELGERHEPETHLIPLVLQVASGRLDKINIYGDDYDTPDGTAIRDYVHVADLCEAHLLALQYLEGHGKSRAFNLGANHGCSVLEVLSAAEKITGKTIPVTYQGRRPGDVKQLVADVSLAKNVLAWQSQYGLDEIISHAWQWELKFPGKS